jgi:hypothetical protein
LGAGNEKTRGCAMMNDVFTIADCNTFYAICGSHEEAFFDALLYASIYFTNMDMFIQMMMHLYIHVHCDELATDMIHIFHKSQRYHQLLLEIDNSLTMDANDFFVFCVVQYRGIITSRKAKKYLWNKYGFDKIVNFYSKIWNFLINNKNNLEIYDTLIAFTLPYFMSSLTTDEIFLNYVSRDTVLFIKTAFKYVLDYPFPIISIMDKINDEPAQPQQHTLSQRILADEYIVHSICGKIEKNGLLKMNSKLIQIIRQNLADTGCP